ncbi:DUF3575 domain-containing protein [Muricauda sp. SCSIO 64092]|uniref:DUF3575 domain-containing protein n=1 Tax=Allomuricauda sp. SCSIO 64092 TaxID=2908842 RepID=UPI001FF3BBD1|nr:DUF3575 domain-containing protein [Muricauda sp. SCSIO 64092]UOY05809.1 DUF3575 domain-containing protein [Muricauda sp. SCSIO 64092]
MKTRISFLAILFTTTISFAQTFRNVERNQFKVRLFSPGFEYEKGLGSNTTMIAGASIQLAARPGQNLVYWGIVPAVRTGFRYYTNFDRRLILRKKYIEGNSANYVGAVNTLYYATPLIKGAEIAGDKGIFGNVGVVYGMQRTLPVGFNYDMGIGLGYYYDANYGGSIGPIGGIAVGWAF